MAITVDVANLGTFINDGAAGTAAITTTSAVASGGFIVAAFGWFASSDTLISGSGGGLTWSVDVENAVGSTGVAVMSAQAPSGLASGTTITGTFNGTGPAARTMGATSLLGVKTSSPLDGTPGTVSDTNAWSSGSRTIAAGSILMAANYTVNLAGSNSPTAPSLEAWEVTDVPDTYGEAMVYRIEAAGGSFAAGGTWAGGTFATKTAYVAYLAAPAGGAQNQLAWIRA